MCENRIVYLYIIGQLKYVPKVQAHFVRYWNISVNSYGNPVISIVMVPKRYEDNFQPVFVEKWGIYHRKKDG